MGGCCKDRREILLTFNNSSIVGRGQKKKKEIEIYSDEKICALLVSCQGD